MKVLIVYATRNGVSRRCAEMLKQKLDSFADVDIYNIKDKYAVKIYCHLNR